MRKVTKIVLGVTTLGVLATSAFAYGCQGKGQEGNCNFENKKCNKMMYKKAHKRGHGIMGAFMQLDLTSTQKDKIMKIMEDARASIEKPTKAFTASEFNKAQFVKLVKEQKEARIEKRAETIEKVYALLNSEQKKELKTLLDKKAEFKGCKFDKNSNGRG